MKIQEQIDKLNAEYLSRDATRDPYSILNDALNLLILNDALNLLDKQSEMMKVAKEALSGLVQDLIMRANIDEENNKIINCGLGAFHRAKQALKTIEEIENALAKHKAGEIDMNKIHDGYIVELRNGASYIGKHCLEGFYLVPALLGEPSIRKDRWKDFWRVDGKSTSDDADYDIIRVVP